MPSVFFLPCFFSRRCCQALTVGQQRTSRHTASEKAHFRWALPIFLPPCPSVLPADLCTQRTRRAYERKSPAVGKRRIVWISYSRMRARILPTPGTVLSR